MKKIKDNKLFAKHSRTKYVKKPNQIRQFYEKFWLVFKNSIYQRYINSRARVRSFLKKTYIYLNNCLSKQTRQLYISV